MTATRHDVAVTGGGIAGLACAWELAARGLRVLLLERDRCGRAASAAAAGLLQPFAEPPEPGPWLEVLRAARALWPRWLAGVLAHGGPVVETSDWGTLFVELDIPLPPAVGPAGAPLDGDRDEATATWLHTMRLGMAALREPVLELDCAAIRNRVPQLTPAASRGLLLPQEGRVDNVALCQALLVACRSRGVEVREETPVSAVELGRQGVRLDTPAGSWEADRMVLAAGAWSGGIPGLPRFPVCPRRGQMLYYDGCAWDWTGCLRAGRRYAVRRGADGLLVGSTVEDAGFEAHTTPEVEAALARFAAALFPELAGRTPRTSWAGLRPATADELPLLGRWGNSPLWLATGYYRSGILLGPWAARRVAVSLCGEEPDTAGGNDLLSPNRFYDAA